MGPLQLVVTWYKIRHAGEQAVHWDIQNKATSSRQICIFFVVDVPVRTPAWWIFYHVTASCKGPTPPPNRSTYFSKTYACAFVSLSQISSICIDSKYFYRPIAPCGCPLQSSRGSQGHQDMEGLMSELA